MANRARTMKVDKDLAKIIEDFAKKNELSLREASKEVARSLKPKMKELKF